MLVKQYHPSKLMVYSTQKMMSSRNGGSSLRFSKRHFFHDLCRSTPGGWRLHQAMEDGVAMEAETYAEYDCSQWMQLVEADLVLVELAFVKNHGGHWKHESQLDPHCISGWEMHRRFGIKLQWRLQYVAWLGCKRHFIDFREWEADGIIKLHYIN